jgi:hypothetical protein
MFWGAVIKEGKPWKAAKQLEDAEYPVLHISQAALPKNAPAGKVHLCISNGKDLNNLTICSLTKDKQESHKLDLYIHIIQPIVISMQGPGEIHLSGYVEPSQEMEDNDFMAGADLDDEEDAESEEEEPAGKQESKKLNKNIKTAQANAQKNSKVPDSDEEDDEDAEDYQIEGDLPSDDEDSEDKEQDAAPVAVPKGKVSVTKGKIPVDDSDEDDADDRLADDSDDDDDDED